MYTPDQYAQWFQTQYGQALDPNFAQQMAGQVGAPQGANGTYSQQQYDQAQQLAANQMATGGQPQAPAPAPFFPEFQAPTYEAGPAYQPPPQFQAPTMDQALADPGYQFSLNQGLGALQGSQAARGVARTGGAMKGLIDYGQQAAATQYGNVYNRAANEYANNYQMGRQSWMDNESQRQGAFDRNYRGASDAFNARFRGRELSFEDMYRRWNTNVNVQAQMALGS